MTRPIDAAWALLKNDNWVKEQQSCSQCFGSGKVKPFGPHSTPLSCPSCKGTGRTPLEAGEKPWYPSSAGSAA